MDFRDLILTDLKNLTGNDLVTVFTTCLNLCEKYNTIGVWDCFEFCHDRFNVYKVYELVNE